MTRHLFILNPKAGVKCSVDTMKANISELFRTHPELQGESYEIHLTEHPGDATRITAQALRESSDSFRVYACGGDGTLHEVVNGAVGSDRVAVCPIPVGSGNDFIRYFDEIPKERFLDLSACVFGKEKEVDVLRCGDIYSINSISVGLDAFTAKRQRKVKHWPLISGGAAYKLALAYSFLVSMKNPIRFEIDGKPVTVGKGNVTLAVMGNGKWYGGGFCATPLSDISDGWMDFCTIRTISRFKFLTYVGDYKKGNHLQTIPELYYTKCKKIRLISDDPVVFQADGEIFQRSNPEIEIVPNAIRLILPRTQSSEAVCNVCQPVAAQNRK